MGDISYWIVRNEGVSERIICMIITEKYHFVLLWSQSSILLVGWIFRIEQFRELLALLGRGMKVALGSWFLVELGKVCAIVPLIENKLIIKLENEINVARLIILMGMNVQEVSFPFYSEYLTVLNQGYASFVIDDF